MRHERGDEQGLVWKMPERVPSARTSADLGPPGTSHSRSAPSAAPRLADVVPSAGPAAARDELRELIAEAARVTVHAIHASGWLDVSIDPARPRLRRAGVIARARDVRAERVILMLKEEWRKLPEPHGLSRNETDIVLARVVTLCIQEYFAAGVDS